MNALGSICGVGVLSGLAGTMAAYALGSRLPTQDAEALGRADAFFFIEGEDRRVHNGTLVDGIYHCEGHAVATSIGYRF
jgi:hypothetical protein